MSLEHDLRELVATSLGESVVVDEVTVTPAGRRRVVRVTVERLLPGLEGSDPVEPLTLDEVADATRVVSESLDATDLLGSQPYTLEVSTPGVSRPLTSAEHFRRNVGRLVDVDLEGQEPVTGRVRSVTAHAVVLEIPAERKRPAEEVEVSLDAVRRGRVQVEFNRPKDAPDAQAADDLTADPTDENEQ